MTDQLRRLADTRPGYGVEINAHRVESNHGCCVPGRWRVGCERRDQWPGWALDFDAHWTPEHPRRRR